MARHDTDHRRRQYWAEQRRTIAARDEETIIAVKQVLRSAERLRALNVTTRNARYSYKGDSWKIT